MRLEFGILGPLELQVDGGRVPVARAKQRALLEALLLRANEVVSSEQLVDAIWGGRPPATAASALLGHVSQLRKLLPPDVLVTRPPGYALVVPPDALDLERFEALRAAARAAAPGEAVRLLREALALWRGAPVADLAEDALLQSERPRLEELRATAEEELLEAELAAGGGAELLPRLEALVAANPFRERPRAQLLLALYRAGRQADALEAYRAGRELLVEELGIEPGPELQQLQQRILRQDPDLQPTPSTPTLVGRDAELARLEQAVADACAGRFRVVLLVGESGIGKTTLAEAAEAHALARGAAVLWTRSYEDEGAPPYWLWTQLLRGLGEELALGEERDRFRLFDELAGVLRRAAQSRPLLLVLDDVHWADAGSLLALQFVARTLRGAAVAIVATYRDDRSGGDGFASVVGQLVRERVAETLHVRGLDRAAVDALAAGAGVDAELLAETDGNPFFVREILRHVAETGELAVPETVRALVLERLDRVSAPCRELLVAGAVLGEFSEPVVGRLLDAEPDQVLRCVDEAVGAGLLAERTHGRYACAHALVRESLTSRLDTPQRIDLHRRAGEALETLPEPPLDELARHFFEAARGGDRRKGIDYCRRAAARATAQLAYEQAAQQLVRALQLLELEAGATAAERCELLLALGDAHWRSGAFRRARRTFRDAAELARSLDDPRALARSAIGYAGGAGFDIAVRNDFLVELLADALAALPDDEAHLRARLEARLAQALIPYPDRGGERSDRARDALALAAGDDETLAYVLTSTFLALWTPDDARRRVDTATQLLRLGTRLRHDAHRLNGLSWRIPAYAELGDADEIDADLREFERIVDRRPVAYARWGLLLLQAQRALLHGDVAEGRRLAELALETGQADDNPNALLVFAIQSIGIARCTGFDDILFQLSRTMVDRYPTVAGWRAIASTIAARHGDDEVARADFDLLARRGFDRIPRDLIWTAAIAFAAETAALVGASPEHAAELYELLAPVEELNLVLAWALYDGPIARRRALLAAVLGRREAVEAHLATALAAERRIGAAASSVHTQADVAAAIARYGGPAERAGELAAAARADAERLGLPDPTAARG